MQNEFKIKIPIPTDTDGYILLQCEYCGILFKLKPEDIESDEILHIFCPGCGLVSPSYITENVVDLANAMANNVVIDMLYNELKKTEFKTKDGLIKLSMGPKPYHEPEIPVYSGIEMLQITDFPCCKRSAKIKPLLKQTGCYCPFCGVKNYEVE